MLLRQIVKHLGRGNLSILAALLLLSSSASPLHADPDARTFPETGRTVRGRFLRYWDTDGGLAQQGYPISEEIQERNATDGQTYTVQYFERAVFEAHLENTPPYDVLLARLGADQYRQKYPNDASGQEPNTTPGSVAFPETGKRLGGSFLHYWQSHGGLVGPGYPISDEFWATSDRDGPRHRVQYFERAVFEAHPENTPPYDVLLSQLGTLAYQARPPELHVDFMRNEGVLYAEFEDFESEEVSVWTPGRDLQPVTTTIQVWFDPQNLYRFRRIATETLDNESHVIDALASNGVDAWFEIHADRRIYEPRRHSGRYPYYDNSFDDLIYICTDDRVYDRLARGDVPQIGERDEAPWGKLLTAREVSSNNYVVTSTVRAETPHILVSMESVNSQGELYQRKGITRWGWYAPGALSADFWLSPPPNIPQRPPE